MDPIKPGDPIVLNRADLATQHGVVESVASWEWIRFRTGDTYWLEVLVPSGFVSWSLICRLSGPTADTDCDRIAKAAIAREHKKMARGTITDVTGLAETYPTAWRMDHT